MNPRILILASCLLLFSLGILHAGKPMEMVEKNVNEVVSILNSIHDVPAEHSQTHEAKRNRAHEIIRETFDFNVLARRALGRHYRAFNEEQYTQFVESFTTLLFNNYYNRIKDYTVDNVQYVKETMLTDTKAEVQTIVESRGQKYPIDYRLYEKDGQWQVYDVIIEGVSMINNYRSQFTRILEDKNATSLLEMLSNKNLENADK